MRITLLILLALSLTGCTALIPLVLKPIHIASDIPASTMPCVKPQLRTDSSEVEARESVVTGSAIAFALSDFPQLEAEYKIYRNRASRTSGGRWHLKYFYDGILNPDFFGDEKDEKNWIKAEEKILEWIKAYPDSPAPYIVYSDFLINRAWHFRGGGFKGQVPQSAWEPFEENINLARDILEKSKEIASVDPNWYVNMLGIARDQGWSKRSVRALLQEALSKEAYYHDTYHAAFSYLLPKWSGSVIEAEQFAQDAVRITSQCEGQSLYAQIYWTAFIANIELGFDASSGMPVQWAKMSTGFEDLIQRYPIPWYVNNYAKFACLAGDQQKAQELMKQIGNKPTIEAWTYRPEVNFSACQQWASASGEFTQELQQ